MQYVFFALSLGIAIEAFALQCPDYQQMLVDANWRYTALVSDTNRLKQENANAFALIQQHQVEIDKGNRTLSILVEGEERLIQSGNMLSAYEKILLDLIAQDRVLGRVNRELELAIQRDADLDLIRLLEEATIVFSRQLNPRSREMLANILNQMKEAERFSQRWREEQSGLIKRLRLKEGEALLGILQTTNKVVALNFDYIQRSKGERTRLTTVVKDRQREIDEAKERIEKNLIKMNQNKIGIDDYPAQIKAIRNIEADCKNRIDWSDFKRVT